MARILYGNQKPFPQGMLSSTLVQRELLVHCSLSLWPLRGMTSPGVGCLQSAGVCERKWLDEVAVL